MFSLFTLYHKRAFHLLPALLVTYIFGECCCSCFLPFTLYCKRALHFLLALLVAFLVPAICL